MGRTKVVILAAGKGSRLGDPDLPKPLTMLANEKSILGWQLEQLSSFLSLDNVLVVVGYRLEKILDKFPDLLYVYNPFYSTENTSKSLLRALRKVDEDVLWINGDVVFHPSILKSLFEMDKTCMVVNEGATGEEEVKYRTDSTGRILEVSKSVSDPQGEALGINFFKKGDLPHLIEGLSQCDIHDYFEKGIEFAIQKGVAVQSLTVLPSFCTEVDFPEDLTRANHLIKSW